MKRLLAVVAFFTLATNALAQDITLPEYERVVLDNGAVLLLAEKHDVPLVGMRAAVRGGYSADPVDQSGLAGLLSTLLAKGAGDRDAAAFAEAAAAVGGEISATVGIESTNVTAEFLSRDAELMIDLVADMLMRPTLSEDEFLKERDRSVALIQSAKASNPSALLGSYGNAFIFGEHPYGNPQYGAESSLADLDYDALRELYAGSFGGDRLIIAVVGDFDLEAMRARLSEVFGAWAPAAAELPSVTGAPRAETPRVLLVDKPGSAQTYFWIGGVGVPLSYADRAELRLANTLFGGRFTSILNTALRVENGLTYGARSAVDQYTATGSVTIRTSAETSKTEEAIDMAIQLLGEFHVEGVDEEMITSARNYIMGQYPPSLETASSLAGTLAYLELNGLGRDYIDNYAASLAAATPESVLTTIGEVYPTTDKLVFVIIGDAEALRESVSKYGPVTEMSITEPRFRPQERL